MSQNEIKALLQGEHPGVLRPGTVFLELDGFIWRAYDVSAYALFSAVPSLVPERVWLQDMNKPVVQVTFPMNEISRITATLEEKGLKLTAYSSSEKYAVFTLPETKETWALLLKDYSNWMFKTMLKNNIKFSA